MNIYIYFDSYELDEEAESVLEAMQSWLDQNQSNAQLVNRKQDEADVASRAAWDIGFNIQTNKRTVLAKPMDALYDIAKNHKLECVVGLYDESAKSYEDVCYFGYEEGKPDMFEIACYLGLPK